MEKRKLKVEDLFELASVASPKISPDGQEAVFVKTQMNEEENKYVANLFHVDLETNEVSQWTYGNERVSSPAWSSDGKQIAFLSNRDEKNQVYILPRRGGEAKKVTDFGQGVSSFVWSPCGKKIWVNASVKEGQSFTDKEEKNEKKKPEPYRVTKMKYQMDGVGLIPQDSYRHIGIVDIESGDVTQITEGNHQYSLMAVSHSGDNIVFGVNRAENQDYEFRQPLYLADVHSKEETALIDEEGYYGGVAFSNDDQYIAFVGADRTFQNATQSELYVYDRENKSRTCLTENLDAPVGDSVVADLQQGTSAPSVVWTETNDLYFRLSTMGDVRLYYASLEGAIYPASPENEHIYDYEVSRDGEFAVVAVSNAINPGELYKQTIATGERQVLTAFNKEYIEQVELVEPEAIVYQGAKGWDVHGWLMKPVGYEEGEKYPLIVEIHGGPAAMYANTFFHELQLLAAQGYGVLYVNPRGSHGYSQEHVNAVRGDYGGGDYEDIIAGLDYAIEHNDWIDTERLGVTGGSYGGFMTNWIVGHTNRFKAAVTQRSISNWISFFGVSDIGYYFNEWQHGADMNDVETLWNFSPLKYAKNIETPLLILHSENDLRCPMEQAEQLYITLKSMGKETELVRFPDADHNLSRTGLPNLRIARLNEITGWFEKYL
ncbi:S9 family peptidase [Sporosarcina pasteurii]|uniref:Prolyl tripeptidyl peptidase n=1 Tax=Sporosarcina pasteurii TaxID=1474 RepID=A0A380BDY8_SPOPA|nr:S9 family peptidase [Sporosarcina pasteurii]MDS9470315.1 S9 family peptidase [Sporosarcina pasteurii]QBQ05971.1 S9 family peptidase [Sporosarcina pasteurii]SUI99785.1 Prolyl tripeptidyl peptidase precursor [Sporosarcina pasteurii]